MCTLVETSRDFFCALLLHQIASPFVAAAAAIAAPFVNGTSKRSRRTSALRSCGAGPRRDVTVGSGGVRLKGSFGLSLAACALVVGAQASACGQEESRPVIAPMSSASSPPPAAPPAPSSGADASAAPTISAQIVQQVVRTSSVAVRRKCWDVVDYDGGAAISADVLLTLDVDSNGAVQSSSAHGSDPTITACVEREARSWTFPAGFAQSTINIPFRFVKQ
jgi:hypothetical protein